MAEPRGNTRRPSVGNRTVLANLGYLTLFGPVKLRRITGIRAVEALLEIPVVRRACNLFPLFAAQRRAVAVAHSFEAILQIVILSGFLNLLFLLVRELSLVANSRSIQTALEITRASKEQLAGALHRLTRLCRIHRCRPRSSANSERDGRGRLLAAVRRSIAFCRSRRSLGNSP